MLRGVHGRWVKLSGTELLPGDVVSVGRSVGQNGEDKSVPADMLLLAGTAIVNEAILTGESTPQWKVIFLSVLCLLLFIYINKAALYLFHFVRQVLRQTALLNDIHHFLVFTVQRYQISTCGRFWYFSDHVKGLTFQMDLGGIISKLIN